MLVSHARGKVKATCECGAQAPRMSEEDFNAWKRTDAGKEWVATHRPHGKVEAVVRGGRRESLDESVEKIEKKRTKASRQEIESLVEHFNKEKGF